MRSGKVGDTGPGLGRLVLIVEEIKFGAKGPGGYPNLHVVQGLIMMCRPCAACARKGYECIDRACKSCLQRGRESECNHGRTSPSSC